MTIIEQNLQVLRISHLVICQLKFHEDLNAPMIVQLFTDFVQYSTYLILAEIFVSTWVQIFILQLWGQMMAFPATGRISMK